MSMPGDEPFSNRQFVSNPEMTAVYEEINLHIGKQRLYGTLRLSSRVFRITTVLREEGMCVLKQTYNSIIV